MLPKRALSDYARWPVLFCSLAVGGCLLIAGVAKLTIRDPGHQPSLFFSYCGDFATLYGRGLGATEVAVGVLLLLPRTRLIGALFAVALLGSFTGLLLREIHSDTPVPCACFGGAAVSRDAASVRRSLWIGIARNVLLIGCAMIVRAYGITAAGRDRGESAPRAGSEQTAAVASSARCQGFTVAELVVVVAILALLMGILLGTISGVRERSRTTLCASNLRQIMSGFSMYASENRGYVPRAGDYFEDQNPVWLGVIPRYLGLPANFQWADLPRMKVLQCPSHPTEGIPSAYLLNAFAMETAPAWRGSPPVRWSRAVRSADLVWLVEATDKFGPAPFNPFDAIFFEPYHVVYSPDHISVRVSSSRHAGRLTNVAFADGHVTAESAPKWRMERFDDGIRSR